jgi:uncharacterized protein
MNKKEALRKKQNLIHNLKEMGSLLVAFSGGVDSSFLLSVAHEALGQRVFAATAVSAIHAEREKEEALRFTAERGIAHALIRSEEMSLSDFVSNPADRCYHCKRAVLQALFYTAKQKGMNYLAHGANVDDGKDYRPGFRAAKEMGAVAPLLDVHLRKEEIRFLSKEIGLSTWNKPARACLASRIPYGDTITEKKLKMVEKAENFLQDKGFSQFRVRHHGPVARIELERSEIDRITDPLLRKTLVESFRQIGFVHIAIDLEGYVMGSMNRVLLNTSGKGQGK